MSEPIVRRATEADLPMIAQINAQQFNGQKGDLDTALRWVRCRFASHPIYHYCVIEREGCVVGYIGWEVHGGFLRPSPALELEQIAIDKESQKQGLGDVLTRKSMDEMLTWIQAHNNRIESNITVFVWGYSDNFPALSLYAKRFPHARGFRMAYGGRAETMFAFEVPWRRSVREAEGKGIGDA